MAFEEINNVEVVTLGGVNKKTGKPNPTSIEGYLIRTESRPNRFNPGRPQNFYVFLTDEGEKGVYGKAGIDSALKGALPGAMVKLWDTGKTLDTGKGNPMRVFKAAQDKSNTIDPSLYSVGTPHEASSTEEVEPYEETSLDDDEVTSPSYTAPKTAKTPSSANASKVQGLIANRR